MPHLPPLAADTPHTLADRLQRVRRARFVGRARELLTFVAMVEGHDPRPTLFLHGPGGIGKSALLMECARAAEQRGRSVVRIDGRHVEPTPRGFVRALREALGLPGPDDGALLPLPDLPEAPVLLIDTLERIGSLERWLLEDCLPALPADALIVLAGRNPPGQQWRLDPGWAELSHRVLLRALADDESRDFLGARGVAPAQCDAAVALAHGNPLVLTLLADALLAGRAEVLASPAERRALFRSLADRLAADAPTPAHARALRVLTFARVTTEAMLAEVVDAAQAASLYDWLRALSFVEEGEHGLFPHDLVRETFEADLFAHDPEGLEALRVALMRHLGRAMRRVARSQVRRLAHEWTFLARDTAVFRYLDWTQFDRFHADTLRAGDDSAVLEHTMRAFGAQSSRIAAHWLRRQPQGFQIVRDLQRRVVGFWLAIDLAHLADEDCVVDPAIAPLRALLDTAPPRENDLAFALRFCVHDGKCSFPSPTLDFVTLEFTTQFMSDTRMAWSLFVLPEPQRWQLLSDSIQRFNWHHREPALDFTADGVVWGGFVRHWSAEPNPLWHLRERNDDEPSRPALNQDEFAQAVRDALKNFARDDKLQTSPLLDSELLRSDAATADVEALRRLLSTAVDALARHPRDEKFHHALRLTWIDPGKSQEQVAAELGLPFNTYRYHLIKGLERVTQALWRREFAAGERPAQPRVTAARRRSA